MIHQIELGDPALAGVVNDLEKRYGGLTYFSFSVDANRQKVGKMISQILEPYGYVPDKEKPLGQNTGASVFKNAHTYKYK